MKSCLYEGWVRHRRHAPVPHAFRYGVYMTYLDLAELDEVFRGRWLWSTRRPAVSWFRRADHLGDPGEPLDAAVRALVEAETGRAPAGPIRLLTNLRTLGYVMNPVSFYYCFDADDARVEAIVAEVHNTPWGERHCYVLDERRNEGTGARQRHRFPKSFHVSPFMPMEQRYDWRLGAPADRLCIHMDTLEDGAAPDRPVFDATMILRRRPITGGNLARALVRHPFMTGRVAAAIYAQALRLRLKRVPFHPHPKHRLSAEANPS